MDGNCQSAKKVFVCGAGHQGLSMAAHLSISGLEVNLWNRTQEHIQKIIDTGVIRCSGLVSGDAHIANASSDISTVVEGLIMVTVPSNAHKDIAKMLSPYVNPNTVIVLNPGRTFGAIEFAEELKRNGVKELPQIAETQTIVYTCRKNGENSASVLALKKDVKIAAIRGSSIDTILSTLPDCLRPYFTPVDSVGYTSLSNIGMILHCAPVLMNVGWIECPKAEFKYYYDGISPTVAALLEKMDFERRAVASAAGYCVESLKQWLERTYDVTGENLHECIRNNEVYREIDAPPTVNTRYLFEDVPNGLVPVEAMGHEYGVETPAITTIIDLACSVMNNDYRKTGRCFSYSQLKQYL